ncbi:Ankyrin repeats (3 copies) [Serratia marcescens]|uniref:ankyrin repeat domain-containing protein n=1 Tax=Serratia TaxID=613 RepID=UPI0007450979|nr:MULTISPECIES: ankyrin repeat domain-containing protein [Serratia]EBX2534180.1 ankyrin repeat domain-containing protein [Salmonella enterica subsp. enterica serovar Fluntern]EID1591503.1 ankyrin repeat domain-containing protein [Salmonella enterica subsp. enterica serovar Infantis]HBV7286723.1 ankyrin repeat domain-containing protein [Klebsiella pneumoniae]HDL6713789.1 ankyrin repeat domain-containing protein [Yersinia enterocolitica]CVD60096.1 Ankyrin repeats (3 copies) [Serratia marcescens
MIAALLNQIRTTGFVLLSQFDAVLSSPALTPEEQEQKDASLKMLLPLLEKNHDERYLITRLLDYTAQDLLAVYLSGRSGSMKAYALLQLIQNTSKLWPSGFYHAVARSGLRLNDELDTSGLTPIQLAAAKGNVELFKLLLLDGADLYQKNKDGMSAYDLVLNSDNAELLMFMIRYENADISNYRRKT